MLGVQKIDINLTTTTRSKFQIKNFNTAHTVLILFWFFLRKKNIEKTEKIQFYMGTQSNRVVI